MILNIGTDCTLFHGFRDYLNYNHREDGIRNSPFAGSWIYDEKNKSGDWRMNYGSLGIVADLIESNFKGWDKIKNNFRGKPALIKYPVEFTYIDKHDVFNKKSIRLFMEKLNGNEPLTFCSVWRPYIGFDKNNFSKNRLAIFSGFERFEKVVKAEHETIFFFVIDRSGVQLKYINNIMVGSKIKYGILYNEKDEINTWRAYRMKFDCTGWDEALRVVGLL